MQLHVDGIVVSSGELMFAVMDSVDESLIRQSMPVKIHPSAVIESTAEIGADVEIGPFAYVGGVARIGDGTRIHHHASGRATRWSGKTAKFSPMQALARKRRT